MKIRFVRRQIHLKSNAQVQKMKQPRLKIHGPKGDSPPVSNIIASVRLLTGLLQN